MKTTLQKNGDVLIRLKLVEIPKLREATKLFLDAYVDPEDLERLTDEEKLVLILDSQITRAQRKRLKQLKKKKGYAVPQSIKDEIIEKLEQR